MKILQLTLKNINSLVGVHEIDFTETAFSQDGLFAITGPTGAGKTSILDAIALALYGKTPRVDVTGSENPIMTKGEKDCFAEVTFLVNDKVWKSSWSQAINRNGNLNPVKRIIADDKGEIHADQTRTCDTKIIEILGLTFEQFTKVIMLAQGNFAAFLQADKNEKGKLLEQLTGTEIYGQISRKVFERHSEEKAKFDRINVELGTIQILTTEEINHVKHEIERLQNEQVQINETLKQLEEAAAWQVHIADLNKQISKLHIQLPQIKEQAEEAQQEAQIAQRLWEEAKHHKNTLTPIFNQVRGLDTQLQDRLTQLPPIRQYITDAERSKDDLDKQISHIQSVLSEEELILKEKQIWSQQNIRYSDLISDFNSIAADSQTVEKLHIELQSEEELSLRLQNEVKQLQTNCTQSQKLLDEKKTELEARYILLGNQRQALQHILAGKTIQYLHEKRDKIINTGQQIKELIQIEKNIIQYRSQIQKQDDIIKEATPLIARLDASIQNKEEQVISMEKHIATKEENILLSRTILSLEGHRQALQKDCPCPLCGSKDHPYATGAPAINGKEEELKQEKIKLAQTKRELDNEIKRKIKAESDRQHAIQFRNNEQERLNHELQKQKETRKELQAQKQYTFRDEPEHLAQLEVLRKDKIAEFERIREQLKEADEAEKSLVQLRDVEIPALEIAVRKAENVINDHSNQLKLVQLSLENQQNKLQKVNSNHQQKLKELYKVFEKYGVDSLTQLQQCLDNWNNNQIQCMESEKKVTQLKKELEIAQKDFQHQVNLWTSEHKKLLSLQENIDTIQQRRQELFGKKEVEEEEQQLNKTIQNSEEKYHKVQNELAALHTEMVSLQRLVDSKEQELREAKSKALRTQSIEELTLLITEKKSAADNLLQQIGAFTQKLRSNAEQIKHRKDKLEAKEKQEALYEKWAVLNDLIGSADGKKYRNFAQELTFEYLVDLANQQLKKMSDRYLLKRMDSSNDPFELSVIDKFQNGDERIAKNLSGGEKFIMSLSLALGLATMASKNMRIETMFIDEGFGTLDPDYLDVALSALSSLQSEGKIIGVISHLTELKERIATHIEISPMGNGYSRIQITS